MASIIGVMREVPTDRWLSGLAAILAAQTVSGAPPPALASYDQQARPVLEQYCFGCHAHGKKKGGVAFDGYDTTAALLTDRKTWEQVRQNVRTQVMPPENKPQPSAREREMLVGWIEREVFQCDCRQPDPGRVTLRRLNRTEYNHTLRDLLGVDFQPADDFPQDDVGYGFDNIGDVLSLPPLLLEKYLAAAQQITARTIATNNTPPTHWPASHRRLFICEPVHSNQLACARTILTHFVPRAFRRPVSKEELEPLLRLAQAVWQEEPFERGMEVAVQAVLVSPHFLFRGEPQPQPDDPQQTEALDDFALASRLSYFLWSTMPDERLFDLARRRALRARLSTEAGRMLKDAKAQALVENFAGQWLELRKLRAATPDPKVFPAFSEALRAAMLRETELLFETVMREDRSVLEFLTADYTFVNARLARHYGLSDITGDEFQKVGLKGTGRSGVLTHASVLTLSSNPTRTSPVKRGKFVLDNLLGAPPPPPPPDVPELKEGKELTGTLRERMEQHRKNPLCMSCHERMDPIGFGLEQFDGIGAWRERDGGAEIDATGRLVSGETFDGATGLVRILAEQKREAFVRCLTEKMLTYALGRGLEYYDKCAVDEIMARLSQNQDRFSALVLGIVHSPPFQMRRGEGDRMAVTTRK